jgi:superfamily II DNA or RNA helicase
MKLTIYIYVRSFEVVTQDNNIKKIMKEFLSRNTTQDRVYDRRKRRLITVPGKVYASYNKTIGKYRLSITQIRDFMTYLRLCNVGKDDVNIVEKNSHIGDVVKVKLKGDKDPRDYQVTYIEHLVNEDRYPAKLVDLQTGRGKTFIAMSAISKISERTMILVLPKYIDKWIGDVTELTNTTEDEIYIIKGGDSLRKLIDDNEEGVFNSKFVIMSIRTAQNYIKEYETMDEDYEFRYEYTPDELLEKLKIGVLLNDESHQEFHAVFKTALYFNCDKMIGLSATLENKDSVINGMYELLFPSECRISGIIPYHKYINFYCVNYFMDTRNLQYDTVQGYSHRLLEQTIMRNYNILEFYVDMIKDFIKSAYYDRKSPGDKCLIFANTVDMCALLVKKIKSAYKDLEVTKYTREDSLDSLMAADISVSTVLSAGTALDIPDLITVLQTIDIRSIQSNKQAQGRLRDIKGKDVRYYYFSCRSIFKHKMSNKDRVRLFKPLSKSFNYINYN